MNQIQSIHDMSHVPPAKKKFCGVENVIAGTIAFKCGGFWTAAPLHRARIRQPESADCSIGPRLFSGPLDGVITVAPFVFVGTEFAIRLVPSPDVLNYNGVSTRDRVFEGLVLFTGEVFAVRGAIEEHGKRALFFGSQHVSTKNNAIAHWNFYVSVDDVCLLSGD